MEFFKKINNKYINCLFININQSVKFNNVLFNTFINNYYITDFYTKNSKTMSFSSLRKYRIFKL